MLLVVAAASSPFIWNLGVLAPDPDALGHTAGRSVRPTAAHTSPFLHWKRESASAIGTPEAFLGVLTNAGQTEIRGVLVGSPAARAGLRRGDLILEVDGHPVSTGADLLGALQRFRARDEISLRLAREQHLVDARLVLGARHPAAESDLSETLDRASRYVASLGDELAEVVAEERYRQRWHLPGSEPVERVLQSEFVLVGTSDRAEWVGFRDVYTVDGQRVRDREDRLQQLFLHRDPRSLERARVIADESARYNLGQIHRNVNVPTAALFFLHPANRDRFDFGLERIEDVDDERQWVVRYDERQMPTLVRTREGKSIPARGRFWIEPESGRVVQTQLWLQTATDPDARMVNVNVAVSYARDSGLGLWVPVEMRELYTTTSDERLVATATYDNYRRFRVEARVLTPRP